MNGGGRIESFPTSTRRKTDRRIPYGEVDDIEVQDATFYFRILIALTLIYTLVFLGWYIFLMTEESSYFIFFNVPYCIFYAIRFLLLIVVIFTVTNPLKMGIVGSYDRWRAVASFDPFVECKLYCSLCFSTSIVGLFFLITQLAVFGFNDFEGRHHRLWLAALIVNCVAIVLSFFEPIYILEFGVWRPLRRLAQRKEAELIRTNKPLPVPARMSSSVLQLHERFPSSERAHGGVAPLNLAGHSRRSVWNLPISSPPKVQGMPSRMVTFN